MPFSGSFPQMKEYSGNWGVLIPGLSLTVYFSIHNTFIVPSLRIRFANLHQIYRAVRHFILRFKLLAVIDDVVGLTSDDFGKTENFCLHQGTKFEYHNIIIQKRR